jgi:Fibronectin type III domain
MLEDFDKTLLSKTELLYLKPSVFLSVPASVETITCKPLNTTAVNVTVTPPPGINDEYHLAINTSMPEYKHSESWNGTSPNYVFGNLSPGVMYDVWAYTVSGDTPSAAIKHVQCRTGQRTVSLNVKQRVKDA